MREIRIQEIEGTLIGQTENKEAGTGCTVLISKEEMAAEVVSEAIIQAVVSAESAYGYPSAVSMQAIFENDQKSV